MRNNKIGILTFHRANNYGAVLQNYALQEAIRYFGKMAETIDYRNKSIEKQYRLIPFFFSKNPLKIFSFYYWHFRNLKSIIKSNSKFKSFRKNYVTIGKQKYTNTTIGMCDYQSIIVGSDQVWNETIIKANNEFVYNLSFFTGKKCSYAASCGSVSSLIKNHDCMSKFDLITVREKELALFLNSKGINCYLVCDPVFLLDSVEWTQRFHLKLTDEKYVYLYYIDSGRDEASKISKYLAFRDNCKVLCSRKLDKESKLYGVNCYSDGPIDFLEKVYNAHFIVASSFHGVAFSIIFHKQFVALLHNETGSRVASLLEKLGLDDRIVSSFDDFVSKELKDIDYDKVDSILSNWKNESFDYLQKMI